MCQTVQGWSWEVLWCSRTKNEAADALSKNNISKFLALTKKPMKRRRVTTDHLSMPCIIIPGKKLIRGAGLNPHRPTRYVLGEKIKDGLNGSMIEQRLREQVSSMRVQAGSTLSKSGVCSYLRFCERLQWKPDKIIPSWENMVDNLSMYAADAVQSYMWNNGGKVTRKRGIAVSSLRSYLSHINVWYAEITSQARGITSEPAMKLVMKILAESFPQNTNQKDGITADELRKMILAVNDGSRDGLMYAAQWALAWIGVLRPGEFTVPTKTGFDVTRHPTQNEIKFFFNNQQVRPGNSDIHPNYLVFVIKQDKTNTNRLARDVVMGITNDVICPVTLLWELFSKHGYSPKDALFTVSGLPLTYNQLRTKMDEVMQRCGMVCKNYGGHSFRIGGSQALAATNKSVAYLMSYGRWKCVDSVMRYVQTPTVIRALDAADMTNALQAGKWYDVDRVLSEHYEKQTMADKLWTAKSMVHA